MKTITTFEMQYMANDWSEEQKKAGLKAWFLCMVTKTELGTAVQLEKLAVFNLDSGAELFQEHLCVLGATGASLVVPHPDCVALYESRKAWKPR